MQQNCQLSMHPFTELNNLWLHDIELTKIVSVIKSISKNSLHGRHIPALFNLLLCHSIQNSSMSSLPFDQMKVFLHLKPKSVLFHFKHFHFRFYTMLQVHLAASKKFGNLIEIKVLKLANTVKCLPMNFIMFQKITWSCEYLTFKNWINKLIVSNFHCKKIQKEFNNCISANFSTRTNLHAMPQHLSRQWNAGTYNCHNFIWQNWMFVSHPTGCKHPWKQFCGALSTNVTSQSIPTCFLGRVHFCSHLNAQTCTKQWLHSVPIHMQLNLCWN